MSMFYHGLNVPKLILKYEDLVYDKRESIRKIISFFENEYDIKFQNNEIKISNIIKSTEFNYLKKLEEKKGFNEANQGNFFRKGEKDQWKKILEIKQINRIEKKFRDFMNKFSYE